MNLKLCYITGWSLLVATGLSAQNRGDLAVKVARDSGQVIELTLQEAVDMARTNSPSAVSARHTFRSAYWSYRSFRANYLPSLTFSSNPDLTRTISKVTLGDGSEKYVSQNMLTVDGELSISQNVSLTGGSFSDKLRFIYFSLPFFDKSEEECESGFEKWIYVLKYMEMDEVFKNLPLAEQKKMLDHLAKLPDVRCLSSEEQEKYDESIKAVIPDDEEIEIK